MYREENTWILLGELRFKRAYFFAAARSFNVKVDADTGKIVFYEETKAPQIKEAKRKVIHHLFSLSKSAIIPLMDSPKRLRTFIRRSFPFSVRL